MNGERDLLEELRRALGCEYLSQLREPEFQARAVELAVRRAPEDYPAKQWRDTAAYLTGEAIPFDSAQAAWAFLSRWVKKRRIP